MSRPAFSIIVAPITGAEDLSAVQNNLRAQTCPSYQIVIAEPHESIAVARNRAATRAYGDYLAFIDSNQLWHASKLEKQLLQLQEKPDLSWCYCRSSGGDLCHRGDILRPLLLKNFIPSGSVVLDRSVFNELGGFNESDECRLCEEWEFWIRIAAVHPIELVDEPLVHLRNQLPPSALQRLSMKRVVELAVARHADRLKDLRSESLAEICMSAGNDHLKANQRNEARLKFEEALTHTPLRSDAYLSWISSFLSSEAQRQIMDLHNLARQLQKMEKSKTVQKIEQNG